MQITIESPLERQRDEHRSDARSSRVRRRFDTELSGLGLPRGPLSQEPVTTRDIEALPAVVQRYLQFMRVVGRPRDWSFRAGWNGRFRRGPNEPWLPCKAWQYDSAVEIARIFYMRLTLGAFFPTVVRDTYLRGHGHMLAKAFDLFKVADGRGPEIDIGELVTYLNDAILYAPSMILRQETRWTAVDEESFDVTLSDAGQSVTARVFIDERGAPRDFSTTDRFVSDPYTKGQPLVRGRWTTPTDDWKTIDGRPIPSHGKAVWHLAGGTFEYADFQLVEGGLAFNVPPGA
jgi:hypothetical protein